MPATRPALGPRSSGPLTPGGSAPFVPDGAIFLRALESGSLDPCHPIFDDWMSHPEWVGLTAEDLSGKTDRQQRELVVGEMLARLSAQAGREASALLFKAQWGYRVPDWFDHRHHLLDPNTHCTDFWTASADNILKSLPLSGSLLNLCSGDGFYDYHFYRKRAGRIVCVDVNPAAHRQALRLHRAETITYILGNVLEYEPFADSFDVVAIRGAIEHFSERDQQVIFHKAWKALKPGGWFCGDTVANSATDPKMLPAHETEWADEEVMRRELERVFWKTETFALRSQQRTTLLWRCRKEGSAAERPAEPAPYKRAHVTAGATGAGILPHTETLR
jgi:SAM-dependent methyltransferase